MENGQRKPLLPFAVRERAWLFLNGVRVNVPASAATAIRRMRLPDQDCTLWIDAVCINQADNSERSAQVALMGSIYKIASGNLIYLGSSE